MRVFKKSMFAVVAGLSALAGAGAGPAVALSLPAKQTVTSAGSEARPVVKVHNRHFRHSHARHSNARHNHVRHSRRVVVDAPFTYVETGRRYRGHHDGRRVIVDAPFTHVSVGRHGRRIIAPFVDLWIPY